MKKPSIYIVEDEPLIVAAIKTALSKIGYTIVGDSDDAIETLKQIDRINPELVLIDIQINGVKDGIELAKELDRMQIPYIYLTSQTDPRTIDRVKQTKPLGYIVKPFTEQSLRSQLEVAWHNYSLKNADHITIKSDGRTYRINQNNILYLKAFDNYCYVHTTRRTHLVPHTLKHVSELLDQNLFVKTHRSYWVNINHIDAVGANQLVLKSEPIPISTSQKNLVLSKIKNS